RQASQKQAGAQPAGAHGSDFAVGCQAAQPNQDSYQHSHRNGDGKGGGDGQEEDFGDAGEGRAVAHRQLQDAPHVAHEHDEGEQACAYQAVGHDLAQDVPSENSHATWSSLACPFRIEACLVSDWYSCGTSISLSTRTWFPASTGCPGSACTRSRIITAW